MKTEFRIGLRGEKLTNQPGRNIYIYPMNWPCWRIAHPASLKQSCGLIPWNSLTTKNLTRNKRDLNSTKLHTSWDLSFKYSRWISDNWNYQHKLVIKVTRKCYQVHYQLVHFISCFLEMLELFQEICINTKIKQFKLNCRSWCNKWVVITKLKSTWKTVCPTHTNSIPWFSCKQYQMKHLHLIRNKTKSAVTSVSLMQMFTPTDGTNWWILLMMMMTDDTSLNRILVGCQEVSPFPDE